MKIKDKENADLEFDFPDDLKFIHFDKEGERKPQGMSFIDFIIETESTLFFIELKDPSNSNAHKRQKEDFKEKLVNNSLISDVFVPKVRDSYTYQHLMNNIPKPIKYIVLLGTDALGLEDEINLLTNFKERLHANIKQEVDIPWKVEYIKDCMVMNLEVWNKIFPDWQVKRISSFS